jgi:hypothetical protein
LVGGNNKHVHTVFLQTGRPPPIIQLQQFAHGLSSRQERGQSTLQFVTLFEVKISALIPPSTYSKHISAHINNILYMFVKKMTMFYYVKIEI